VSNTPFRWPIRVQFVDTDASQRIHYTAMFRYFEMAEAEFMRHLDLSYGHIQNRIIAYPRVHVECDFLGSVTYDELIGVEVTVERVGTSSFTLHFQVTKDKTAVARGRIVVAAMDRNTQRARPLPPELAEPLRQQMQIEETAHA